MPEQMERAANRLAGAVEMAIAEGRPFSQATIESFWVCEVADMLDNPNWKEVN